jgi:diguanylate cyclase (GGDEF)-like protein
VAWQNLAAQQLVRYEALFKLLEDIHGLEDISAIAEQVNRQWKYFANVAHWHMVLADETSYVIVEGFRGQTKLSRVPGQELSSWDLRHWQQQRPIKVQIARVDPAIPVPDHLLGSNLYEVQVLPILRGAQCGAILTVTSRHEPFTDIDDKYIRLLAYYLVDRIASIVLQKRTVELLYAKATRDSLTGILNRGAILEQLETMLTTAKQGADPLSVIIVDIDFFKVINDSHGHQTGDKVLCEVAQRLQAAIRGKDFLGRYGGEEFLLVLGDCSLEQVNFASERIRRAIAETPFATAGIAPIQIKVTISAGTASTTGSMGYDAYGLIKMADNALYRSKAKGRNRITISD